MSSSRHPSTRTLQALLAGELDPPAEAAVAAAREHVRACARCRRALRELERVAALLAADPEPALPRSLWPAVRQALHAADGRRHHRSRRRRWTPGMVLGTAAAATAGIVIGLLMGSLPEPAASVSGESAGPGALWSAVGSSITGARRGDAALDSYLLLQADEGSGSR